MCVCVGGEFCCLKSLSSHIFWEYFIQDFTTNVLKLPLSRKSVSIMVWNPISELMFFDQLTHLTVLFFSLEKFLYLTHIISSLLLHQWLLYFRLPGNGNNTILYKILSLIFPLWLNMEMNKNTALSFPITFHVKNTHIKLVIFLFPSLSTFWLTTVCQRQMRTLY